jgi:alpha-1,2-mannosyltransferase
LARVAHVPQLDFYVYRMGGQHAFGSSLYSVEITVRGQHGFFTYPPVAAVLFWPLSHLSIFAGQTIWDASNLVALTALIAISIAAAQCRRVIRSDWRTALVLLAPISFFLYPVRYHLVLAQINIVLVLMIVADLTVGVSWRGRSLPTGLMVGLAAAIKLTPLVFIPYLVLSRQWRAARNATLAFVLATGAMFALSPRASWLYFTRDAFDVERIGNSLWTGNQSLHAAIIRAHLAPSPGLFGLIWIVVLCAGIGVAVMAYRRSSAFLAISLCGATGLMLSPISWFHHYVWIVPALIWVMIGVDRPAHRVGWAVVAALPFVLIPPVQPSDGVVWYVRSNAYVIWTLAFVGLTGMMLWRRRSQQVGDHQPAPETGVSGVLQTIQTEDRDALPPPGTVRQSKSRPDSAGMQAILRFPAAASGWPRSGSGAPSRDRTVRWAVVTRIMLRPPLSSPLVGRLHW